MNEERLRALLRETRAPGEAEAERRGLLLVNAAFEQRQARPGRLVLPRLAVALAIGTLLAALLLSPAGAAVRDWIDDVFTVGVQDAQPALTEVPGGGRLLVQSARGPWVVQPDGSRRLLGRYGEATWSPRGLFVGAAAGHTLSAIEPDGTVRWSLSADAPVADPRWSPSGVRIAYRAGRALRVVVGDGSGDTLLDRGVAAVPPVWSPAGHHLLAYVDAPQTLAIVNTDTGERVGVAGAPADLREFDWAGNGSWLLFATRRSLLLRPIAVDKLAGELDLGGGRRIRLPGGAAIESASFSPQGETIAVLLERRDGDRGPRSEVLLIDAAGERPRRLFSAPGHLSDLTWSPDGDSLLIGWPDVDQWVFIPAGGRDRIRAVSDISAAFAPGEPGLASFPRVEGWCCPAPR